MIALEDIRRMAATQSLFAPTTLRRALQRLGFVQADPIRAPARAQDLILFHRVKGYRVGDLERHPRTEATVPAEGGGSWFDAQRKQAQRVLAFVRERGEVHPLEVEERFSLGTVRNYWGGSTNATTRLLEAMLYRGTLRVVRREAGIRVFAEQRHGPGPRDDAARRARIDALADAAIRVYAPLTHPRLRLLLRRLRHAVPQWRGELTAATQRAMQRLSHARVDGVDWYWPADTPRSAGAPEPRVRLLSPFDPVVWDRTRFQILWGWTYRFEAYTPAARRKLGYYALPLLWRDRVIGWGNLTVRDGELGWEVGYAGAPPRDRLYRSCFASRRSAESNPSVNQP